MLDKVSYSREFTTYDLVSDYFCIQEIMKDFIWCEDASKEKQGKKHSADTMREILCILTTINIY